ncbi:MAG: hypothetical protein MUC50_21975 [Myxococcota bacterium]|jgi:hypothetical protein|nr:hypothetical protein [Myxococcota bacterium]
METLRLPRKPQGTPLLQDVRGRCLVLCADDSLLTHAKILSEGMVEPGQEDAARFAGSTMMSIDLADPRFDLPQTQAMRAALLDAVLHSIHLRTKILRLARAEAERRVAPLLLCTMAATTRFLLDGAVLRVDVEIESALEDPRKLLVKGVRQGEE